MADRDLVTFGPFTKGVTNLSEDHELTPDQLRQGVNLLLRDSGRIQRRKGFSLERAAQVEMHSAFGIEDGILFVDGTNLILYDPVGKTERVFRSDAQRTAPLAYVNVPGYGTYYSDGVITGRVSAGQNLPWGTPPPSGLPVVSSTVGALYPGRYQIAFTYLTATGEESGAGLTQVIDIGEGQGMIISSSAVFAEGAVQLAVYVSPPNGELLYLAGTLAPGDSLAYITGAATGRVLRTRNLVPPPAGRALGYLAGRIYIADGNILWYTEPLQLNLCRKASNFLLFPGEIKIVAGARDGLYVVADDTHWLPGTDPAAFADAKIIPGSAAKGSLAPFSDEADTWIWFSDFGIVKAGPGGQVQQLQSAYLTTAPGDTGASLFMDDDGTKQIVSISTPRPGELNSGSVASTYLDMEVRRARRVVEFDIGDTVSVGSEPTLSP